MAKYAKFFSVGGGAGPNGLQLPLGTVLDATLRQVQDGTGTGSPLYLSTGSVRIGTTAASAMYWDNTNNRLGIGTNAPTDPLSVTGTTFLTQATGNTTLTVKNTGNGGFNAVLDLFERTNGNLYFGGQGLIVKGLDSTFGGTNTSLGARVGIKGSGSTSATTSLLVQNSASGTALQITDDRTTTITGTQTNLSTNKVYVGALSLTSAGVGDTGQGVYSTGVDGQMVLAGSLYGFVVKSWANSTITLQNTSNPKNLFSIQQYGFSDGNTDYLTGNTLNLAPIYNFTGIRAGTIVRGIYYNPTLTSLTGTTHRAIETVTGDVLFGTTSGNVGIGTTTPTSKLHVSGGDITIQSGNKIQNESLQGLYLTGGGSGEFRFINGGGGGWWYTWYQQNAERMRLNTSNQLCINNTTGGGMLTIQGNGSTSATKSLLVQNSSAQTAFEVYDDKTSRFYNDMIIFPSAGGSIQFGADINNNVRIIDTYAKFQIQRTGIGGSVSIFGGSQGGTSYVANDNGHYFDYPYDKTQQNTFTINRSFYGNVQATTKTMLNITTSNNTPLSNSTLLRGIYFAPTITDWTEIRAFESTAGNVIFNGGNVGIGTTSPTARLQVQGLGSTSATTSLLVQNSLGTTSLSVNDASNVLIGTTTDNGFKLNVNGSINISGGNKLNFNNGSSQCWITTAGGGTGPSSRSILLPGSGGGGDFIFYNDGPYGIRITESGGDTLVMSPGNSSVTGIMSINKSAASGYGGGTFIYYQSVFGNRMYTFGNPNNERGDEGGSHAKIAGGAAGFLGNGGHVYLEAGAKGTQVGSVDGNIIIAATRGNVAIGTSSPTAKTHIVGTGSTSATTSLLVQNSSGNNALIVTDDKKTRFAGICSVTPDTITGGTLFFQVKSGNWPTSLIEGYENGSLGIGSPTGTLGVGSTSLYFRGTFNPDTTGGWGPQNLINQFAFNYSANFTNAGAGGTSEASLIQTTGNTATTVGDVTLNQFAVKNTINNTGGTTTNRGFYYAPTLTSITNTTNIAFQSTSGSVNINTSTIQASAILQADSTTQGFLPPRVTTVQKNAIATPAAGLMVYDTNLARPCFYNGTTWTTL